MKKIIITGMASFLISITAHSSTSVPLIKRIASNALVSIDGLDYAIEKKWDKQACQSIGVFDMAATQLREFVTAPFMSNIYIDDELLANKIKLLPRGTSACAGGEKLTEQQYKKLKALAMDYRSIFGMIKNN